LIRSVLGQHSRINLVNEPELVFALRHAGYTVGSKFSKGARNSLLDELKQIGLCRTHLERNAASIMSRYLESEGDLSFKEVFELLLPRPDADHVVWGEKSLNNLFFIEELLSMYPQARLIHVVRDPRSVILSYYQKKRRGTSGERANIACDFSNSWLRTLLFFQKQSSLWVRWMQIAKQSQKSTTSNNWHEIKFENFLENPRECLQTVCDSVGIEYEQRMVESGMRVSDPALADKTAYAHKKLAEDLDPSRASSYLDLPDQLVWVIERLAGSMMQQFQYSLMHPGISLRQKLSLTTVMMGSAWRLKQKENAHLKKRCLIL